MLATAATDKRNASSLDSRRLIIEAARRALADWHPKQVRGYGTVWNKNTSDLFTAEQQTGNPDDT